MKSKLISLFAVLLMFTGCGSHDPEPIQYGKDNCSFCQMLITDHEFGSELITPKGKVFKFDSIECLVAYTKMPGNYDPKETTVYVTSMSQPGVLFDGRSAMYVTSKEIDSPMGANLAAFKTHQDAMKAIKDSSAVHYTWDKLLSAKTN